MSVGIILISTAEIQEKKCASFIIKQLPVNKSHCINILIQINQQANYCLKVKKNERTYTSIPMRNITFKKSFISFSVQFFVDVK